MFHVKQNRHILLFHVEQIRCYLYETLFKSRIQAYNREYI